MTGQLTQRQQRTHAIRRTTIVGALTNIVLSILKLIVGSIGHSQALIVDGLHSLSDLLSDALVWFAGNQANRVPDANHPYGHDRYETVATLILGVFLFLVACAIGWDTVVRLMQPETFMLPQPITLVVTLVSIIAKEWLFWYTLYYAKHVQSELLRANAWHHRSDAISSIIVLIGIIGTLLGVTVLDTIAALMVVVMIIKIAWDLAGSALRELVDTGLDSTQVAALKQAIYDLDDVVDLHMLRTRTHGGRVSADVHVLVNSKISVSEGHLISVCVEQRIKQTIDNMSDVIVHIDPEDDEQNAPTMGLPHRSEVLARIYELCDGIPNFKPCSIVLHYLNGGIEVELVLPWLSAEPQQLQRDSQRIRQALATYTVIRQLRIYFSAPVDEYTHDDRSEPES
jgi:cation diffusion facilitator family transporter